jgi:hypothetical protein
MFRSAGTLIKLDNLGVDFQRCSPVKPPTWSRIEAQGDVIEIVLTEFGQLGALRHVLPEQSVGIPNGDRPRRLDGLWRLTEDGEVSKTERVGFLFTCRDLRRQRRHRGGVVKPDKAIILVG